jgi:hypothetical protein
MSSDFDSIRYITDPDGRVLAVVRYARGAEQKENLANARLIAAAPDMLKALQTLAGHVAHYASMPHAHSDAHRDVANAYAVIRKATGEST